MGCNAKNLNGTILGYVRPGAAYMKTMPLFVVFLCAMSMAQTPTNQQGSAPSQAPPGQPTAVSGATAPTQDPNRIPPGSIMPAELSKSLDAKKVKPGDNVEAKITMDLIYRGEVVVPRDSKITGHVTDAKPRTKESQDSMVSIVFDRLLMKDGREMSIQGAIQAIGRPMLKPELLGDQTPGEAPGRSPFGNVAAANGRTKEPGRTGGMGTSTPYPGNQPPPVQETATSSSWGGSALDPHSQGVVGIEGLILRSSPQGSVISSTKNNVHLDGGTQLILKTQ
jgi:hypothetical protein